VSSEETSRQAARLICDGLDTIATVYINDVIVGKSSNQFVGYVFDVTGAVQVIDIGTQINDACMQINAKNIKWYLSIENHFSYSFYRF